jgi:hypothetical protein
MRTDRQTHRQTWSFRFTLAGPVIPAEEKQTVSIRCDGPSGWPGYQRTSSPVAALPMIMRWISDVPSKIVKLGRCGQFPQVDGLLYGRLSARTQHAPATGPNVQRLCELDGR